MIIIFPLLLILGYCCPVSQYYNTTLMQCEDCNEGCLMCSGPLACSSCTNGYYLSGTTCPSCPVACSTCLTATACTACTHGFYLSANTSTCQLCSTNCVLCSSSTCSKCNPGLYPSGKDCLQCQVSCDCSNGTLQNCPATTSGMLIAIILTPIMCLFSIILIYCLVSKRCRKKQENTQELTINRPEDFSSISYGLKLIGVMLNMKKNNWTVNEDGDKIDVSETCSICLQKNVDFQTKCEHLFHMKCLCRWLKQNETCPMCKGVCGKQLKKYCKKCSKNYILCDAKTFHRYNVSFFDVCSYCQSFDQTQKSFT